MPMTRPGGDARTTRMGIVGGAVISPDQVRCVCVYFMSSYKITQTRYGVCVCILFVYVRIDGIENSPTELATFTSCILPFTNETTGAMRFISFCDSSIGRWYNNW